MMTEGILSRAELPDWVEPRELTALRFALFYIDHCGFVTEFIFFTSERCGVTLKCVRGHSSSGVVEHSKSNVPPEVLIAAGVEAMRRRGAK